MVLAASVLVHAAWSGTTADAQPRSKSKDDRKPQIDPSILPNGVVEMLALIRDAIKADRIEDLRDAVDWNEMKPDFGTPGVIDPVAHWKAQSADGSGRETLARLAALLDGPPAIVPYGRDIENSRLYIWPRFAEGKLDGLSDADRRQFEQLISDSERAAMLATGTYRGWRLVLGADGTWHTFRRD